MSSFSDMIGTHDERKIARFESGRLIVDTCAVTDSRQPYETAVKNGSRWIVVEMYETKEEAKAGHEKWIKKMTVDKPIILTDVGTSYIKEMLL